MQNAATRGVSAVRKWEIHRRFYEHHGIPLDLIAEITGVQIKTALKRAGKEKWKMLFGAQQLRRKLGSLMDTCLDHLLSGEVTEAEKQLKVLRAMSVSLESLARSEEKIARTNSKELDGRDRKIPTDDEVSLDADGLRALDRELQDLIFKIESDRRAGVSAPTEEPGSPATAH